MNLRYSPDAQADLNDIKEYISLELDNPSAANNQVSRILDAITKNCDSPEIGIALKNKIDISKRYRFWIIDNYYVFYKYSDDSVYVLNVVYKGRDYIKLLFDKS